MSALLTHLSLAWPLAKRDLLARYRGSAVGMLWAVAAPLAMVAIYALVFRGVFQARWADAPVSGLGYATRLFAGLIVFSGTAEVATRATRLMQDNANLVKRVVFPLELLCVALVMQVSVHTVLQMLLLGALLLLSGSGVPTDGSLAWLLLALPWIVVLQLVLAIGLAAIGCYLRDVQHLVPLVMSGLMFLSPVFYPAAAAPPALRAVLVLNPLTPPIELLRAAWFGDALPPADLLAPLALLLLSLPIAHWV
ncbi:MAG: ABC transporter permease, partial [Burkholderiales bacterium]|nr:ABC transporter permease [Burkholderiales bacterium]